MYEAVDNWLSVFHFIVFGDEWEVQQHDCCPFNELLFFLLLHYLLDIHHCLISATSLVHFNVRKKPILYLREDERMEEFRFIDNGIHFFLSDQSWWLEVFVCLATMNIITMLKQNDIYETKSMMICFVSKWWKKTKNETMFILKCISDWF